MAVTIRIEFLTGCYVATRHDRRTEAEWPPHPARLFSALVDAWGTAENPSDDEAAVLRSFECWGPPDLNFSEADQRAVLKNFVPVNDTRIIRRDHSMPSEQVISSYGGVFADGEAVSENKREISEDVESVHKHVAVDEGLYKSKNWRDKNLLPSARMKQHRYFPMVRPHDAVVMMSWPDAEFSADHDRDVFDELLSRVTRLGHSSSLVSCSLLDASPGPSHVPDDDGNISVRVVRQGQMDSLVRRYKRHRGSEPRSLPASAQNYRAIGTTVAVAIRPSERWEWVPLVFRRSDRRLPSLRTADVSASVREALMSHAREPLPEWLSGHTSSSDRSRQQHLAVVPVPFAGTQWSDGRLMGVAVLLPAGDHDARRYLRQTIAAWSSASGTPSGESDERPWLKFWSKGDVDRWLTPVEAALDVPTTLHESAWSWPSRVWSSVTPVALPRHPGDLRSEKSIAMAREVVEAACGHIGLPKPEQVVVSTDPLVAGAVPSGQYPAFSQGKGAKRRARRLVHVLLQFEVPVAGPVVLGSGRYAGLGLMRPLDGRFLASVPDENGDNHAVR